MNKRKLKRRQQRRIKKVIEYLEKINIDSDYQSMVNNFKTIKVESRHAQPLSESIKVYKTTLQIKTKPAEIIS